MTRCARSTCTGFAPRSGPRSARNRHAIWRGCWHLAATACGRNERRRVGTLGEGPHFAVWARLHEGVLFDLDPAVIEPADPFGLLADDDGGEREPQHRILALPA